MAFGISVAGSCVDDGYELEGVSECSHYFLPHCIGKWAV